jgi:multiple sugar transport system substrate-binding protein
MTTRLTRRGLLGSALAGTALATIARPARAASKRLDIIAHRVHQLCLTTGAAGDLTAPWRQANDADIAWATFDSNPLQDRLFREASLSASDVGVAYLVNSRATPNAANVLLPLDSYQAQAPIEDLADIATGLTEAMKFSGRLYAVPVRHATQGLFYNEALLQERGITAPPTTMEELVEQARRLTYTASDGRPVVGMVLASDLSVFPVIFARAYGGDFIGPDFKVLPDEDAMTKALTTLRGMFEAGSLPRSYATTTNEDQVTWIQQGRAAFTVLPFARYAQLNRQDQSRYPGRIKAVEFPVSQGLRARGQQMVSVTEFWAMCILANSRQKDLGWSFIREMSSKAVTLGAARNGNGPVRISTYSQPSFTADQPLAAVEAQALSRARVPLPAFPEAALALAIFIEEVQSAVIGRKSVRDAIAAIGERVRPLMPR